MLVCQEQGAGSTVFDHDRLLVVVAGPLLGAFLGAAFAFLLIAMTYLFFLAALLLALFRWLASSIVELFVWITAFPMQIISPFLNRYMDVFVVIFVTSILIYLLALRVGAFSENGIDQQDHQPGSIKGKVRKFLSSLGAVFVVASYFYALPLGFLAFHEVYCSVALESTETRDAFFCEDIIYTRV